MSTLSLRVDRRTEEADGICSIELVDPTGEALPAFDAGAHIDVHVAPGLVRQYSLCGAPSERRRWRIAVLREPASRGGSAGVHERLRPGTSVSVSAPRNHFALVAAPRTLLLAGGIGITPLLAMAQALEASGQDFELHYCARTPSRMAFRREIESSGFARKAHLHFSDGDPQQRFDAARLLADAQPQTQLYVCGPQGFMDHVLETARACGWSEAQLHREYFAGAVVDASGDTPFELRLARTGLRCQVPPGRSVVQVLAEQGVDVPVSCEAGVCGTCLTRVLEGEPDHRDSYLTDAERAANDQFTPCCSRARSPLLVLDL